MRVTVASFFVLAACAGLSAKEGTVPNTTAPVGDDDDVAGDDDDVAGDDDDTSPGDDDDTSGTGDDDDTTTVTGDDDDDTTQGVTDTDGDGVPDVDDACPLDPLDDADGDGLCDSDDPCPADLDNDTDGDGLCGALDACPLDNPNDTDNDGVCDSDDACPLDRFDDSDGDGLCDTDDPCRFDNPDDTDGDGVCDSLDPCPLDALDDSDGDGACDTDDLCPGSDDALCDIDGDGFGPQDGDCCETTDDCGEPARVNPAAVEAPTPVGGIAVDDDCDGIVDEVDPPCDAGLLLGDTSATSAVNAIGLCDLSQVVSSAYVRANGNGVSPGLSTGLMESFGPNVLPREGSSMLVLSSGRSRTPTQASACGSLTCGTFGAGTPPPGFPQTVPGCNQGTQIFDDLGLDLTLTAPSNAVGYSFSFRFYTFEYPEWVCSQFNDQFITLVTPAPIGSINGNISFDSFTNPVSVNIAYFDVCAGCALGTSELVGTGFDIWDDAGATSWLQTTAPINPSDTFSIRFAIWDTGDNELDSTVLIDNFEWILEGSPGVETLPDN